MAQSFSDEQFERLMSVLQAQPRQHDGSVSPEIGQICEAITAGNKAMLEVANAQARTVRHSNAFHPGISVFSYPEGDEARPKPFLVDKFGNPRECYFCGTRQERESLTPREIILFNQIIQSKLSRNGAWRADILSLGASGERLLLQIPVKTINDRAAFPPSLEICLLEFIGGRDAVDPTKLTEEVQSLRDTISRLAAQFPAIADALKQAA